MTLLCFAQVGSVSVMGCIQSNNRGKSAELFLSILILKLLSLKRCYNY